jgi:carboxypeptidase family protein/TonB-dependent receptor-like protein
MRTAPLIRRTSSNYNSHAATGSRNGRFTMFAAIPIFFAAMLSSPAIARAATASAAGRSRAARIARPARQRADTGETASLAGTVYDSVTSTPLAEAEVQLVDVATPTRAYTVRSDSLGRFRIPAMVPGRYTAGFFHPTLDALGIEPPLRSAMIHAGANVLELVIPGPARIMAAVCGEQPAADSSGAIAGVVRDAVSGLPIGNAKVVVTWHEIVIDKRGLVSETRRVPVQTGEDGSYRICKLPGADTVLASAEIGARRSGVVEVGIPVGGITRRDFSLGDSSSAIAVRGDSSSRASADVQRATTLLRGSAALSGVVHGADGKPVQGATVMVWGTGLETKTRSDGRFALNGLPAGTFSVEARMLGYEPGRVAVDLSPQTPATVDFAFKDRVQQLSRVTIMGKPSRTASDIVGFLDRARNGMGHYITASDNMLKNAIDVTDALRATPGVQVVPGSGFGHVILMRGGCVPVVYVDGMQMQDGYSTLDDIVPPQQVAGMEIYAGLGEAPVQYQSNGCGVLLVWTKR